MVLIGTLKGNGAGFTKLIERLIRGVWTPTAMEFMQPSLWVMQSVYPNDFFFRRAFFYTDICYFQLHQVLPCRLDYFCTRQEDRSHIRASRTSLFRHSHLLCLFQTVINSARHTWSFHSIRESLLCLIPRRNLGFAGKNSRPGTVEGGRKSRSEED